MHQLSETIVGRPEQSGVVWEFPSRGMAVYLDYDVVDDLNGEVSRGFGMLPRRGAEVGGLLLGRVENAPGQTTVIIEGFDPVPCTYPKGPSYHFGDQDRRTLEEKLPRWTAGPDKRLSVVGFYRSHTREDLVADEQDHELCSRYFPDPKSVFLLIRPFPTRVALATFLFWEGGRLERDPQCPEFRFQRAELGGGRSRPHRSRQESPQEQVEPSPEPTVVPSAEFEPPPMQILVPPAMAEARVPQFAQVEAKPRSNWWLWTPVIAIGLAAAGYWGSDAVRRYIPQVHAPAAPVRIELDLVAAEKGGQIEVSWNRSSPVLAAAQRAVLTIVDGEFRKDMELDAEQIRTMHRLLYTSVTPDILFRLEVFGENGSVSESVRVVKGPAAMAAPAVSEAPPPAPAVKPARPKPPAASRTAAPKPQAETPVPERVVPRPERRR